MKTLLQALSGTPVTPPPFWLMRQAGRYLKEYQEVRAEAGDFLSLCFNPKLAAEVTLQPIRRFGMDGAILFADILTIPLALGQDLKFETGEGPKLGELKIEDLRFKIESLEPIFETLRILTRELPQQTTLIGFAGAPWTVATYMIEGGSSREFKKAKAYPQMEKLLDILVDATSQYLISQIEAGAEVVQIFDSWASALDGEQFDKWVIEPNGRIVKNIRKRYPKTPIICFPKGAKDLKKFYDAVKPNAMSIGHETSLEWAFANLPCTIQGNLSPQVLLGTKEQIKAAVEKILNTAKGKPFIFNLGHGIDKTTPVENVAYLSELVKQSL